ncbi:MAG: phosphate/phosphite/phosphonate ABC transporter substrate-binding protein [candidate division NC10 bacterium]|nr:phosphate/phosphite/phosphonate ABC transporter substrate-binding protein [candidate division NC10 bacterium]
MERKRNPWKACLVSLSLAFLAFGGLGTGVIEGSAKKTKAEVGADPGRPLEIAVGAMISPEQTINAYQELMDYISKKLNRPVVMKQRKTYQETNELLGAGRLDAAIICSGAYVIARRQYGIELLAMPVINGTPTYRSYIIVQRDSPIQSIQELKGRSFAFTDPLSNTGYLFPFYYLISKGFRAESFFSKTLFTYSHDNSIEAVAEGVVDGAAVDHLIYDYMKTIKPQMTSKTRVIHKSPPFGSPPVAVPRGLDPGLKSSLREVFLNLDSDPRGKEILKGMGVERFIAGDDSYYNEIRRMLKAVEEKGVSKGW